MRKLPESVPQLKPMPAPAKLVFVEKKKMEPEFAHELEDKNKAPAKPDMSDKK